MKSHLVVLAVLSCFVIGCKKEMIPQKPVGPVSFELVWEKKLIDKNEKIIVRYPVLTPNGGLVYEKTFAGPDDIVTCLDRKTGDVRWTWEDPIDVYDGEKIGAIWAYQDKLAVCSWHETNVVDLQIGKTIWKSDVQNEGLSGLPRARMVNDQIYHCVVDQIPSSSFSELRRTPISEDSWENLNTIETLENGGYSSFFESFVGWVNPLTGDSMLLFLNSQVRFSAPSTNRGDFCAYNLRTRQMEWKIDSIDHEGKVTTISPFLVYNNKAYVMGLITLYCVDLLDKKVIWEKRYNERTPTIYSETFSESYLVIANNMLIVKPREERMFAYNPETGAEIWRTLDGCTGQSDTEVYKDWIFIPSIGNGDVWVHRLSDGKLVTRLKSPRHEDSDFPQAYITHAIEIDQETGMLYCTDGWYMMCFRIKTE